MLSLTSHKRETKGNLNALRDQGMIPGVFYGPKVESQTLQIDEKQFYQIYKEAGESTLINLAVEGEKDSPVLIHEVQRDPLSSQVLHVDFYQPDLEKEVEITVPLVFEGEAPAVDSLGGTLIRNIQEVSVKALPQNLPHEIVVNVDSLATFEDRVLVKDIIRNGEFEIVQDSEDAVAQVVPVEDVEKELEAPIEEDVEGVEREEKAEEEGGEGGEESKEAPAAESGSADQPVDKAGADADKKKKNE